MNLDSMQEIVAAVRREGKPFWEIILETDMANRRVSRGNSLEKMSRTWHTMKEASEVYTGDRRSLSGLSGGAVAGLQLDGACGKLGVVGVGVALFHGPFHADASLLDQPF